MARSTTTRRSAILNALAEKFKEINGSGSFKSRLDDNVQTRMKFWDEIEQYPAVHMAAGAETREYYGGGNKWRFLTIMIRAYVNAEDPIEELEELLDKLEEYMSMSVKVLKAKCIEMNLQISGSKKVLAKRIVDNLE